MNQHLTRKSAVSRVAVGAAGLACLCAAFSAAGADTTSAVLPPGYSTSRTGDIHDFDYFVGGWTAKQRRLKARGVGSSDWDEFP